VVALEIILRDKSHDFLKRALDIKKMCLGIASYLERQAIK